MKEKIIDLHKELGEIRLTLAITINIIIVYLKKLVR
jgi:hypothetical protein